MKLCPICQRCYEDSDATCVQEGHDALVAARPGERLIADKYRLDSLLARGGMGAVYVGTHVELDRPVAVKLLPPGSNADPQAFERFRREARAAARVKHPNIADIYDYGTLANGEAYIVMELVEGETLQERLKRLGKLPIAEAAKLSRQIAEGMEAAHGSGIVHRDLKPSNIILTQDHDGGVRVKLIDFGIAKISEQIAASESTLTATGTLVGTPRYMSPEQCLGHELDARSDVYSFGVILYEMLAGQPPFDAPSAVAIAFKHIHETPPPLTEYRQDVPPLLASLLSDSLSVDPAGRPQTATELKGRLAEIENSLDEHAEPQQAANALPVEEADEFRTQVIKAEEKPVNAPVDEYATAVMQAQPPEKESSKPRSLFDVGDVTIKRAVPLTPVLPAADADARPVSRYFINLSDKTKARLRQPSYIFAGLAVALVIGAIVLLITTRRVPSASSEAVAVSATPSASPTGQPRPSPTASGNAAAKTENKPAEGQATATPEPTPTEDANDTVSEQTRAAVNGALNEWVAATNAGNVDRQMTFYNPTVDVFYRTRNVPRDAVRAEKERLFDQADRIEVRAGDPQITFSNDGHTATTRFRKKYAIEGPEETRQGEVIQELRWVETDSGWKIVGERDVQVIRNPNKGASRRTPKASASPPQAVVNGFKKLFQAIR